MSIMVFRFWIGMVCALVGHIVYANPVVFPVAFLQEAPQVRAALERGYLVANSDISPEAPELAYLEFCEAARMGSAEGHFRAGQSAMLIKGAESRSALFHLQVADSFGHQQAHQLILQHAGNWSGYTTNTLPPCLVEPSDLTAVRTRRSSQPAPVFDLERYASRLPHDRQAVLNMVKKLASNSILGVDFIIAIAAVESNFNPSARSPKNAMGVMQLIPATASRFGVVDPYDPLQNIAGGIKYLEWLHKRFKGDLVLVAAAYNSGEGSVDRYKGVPPFKETQLYVQKVFRYTQSASSAQK